MKGLKATEIALVITAVYTVVSLALSFTGFVIPNTMDYNQLTLIAGSGLASFFVFMALASNE
jgi:hypothetical protein